MDPPYKFYHLHEFDTKGLFDRYLSPAADKLYYDEIVVFPMKVLHKAVATGGIRGEALIDVSVGPTFHHLLPVSEYFKEITVLEFSDACIKDLEKWVKKGHGAYDLSHTSKFLTELQETSDKWEEKEENVRKRIKRILKCDFTKENPTDPVALPKADCIVSLFGINVVSKDQKTYSDNLKKLSIMLKPGGRLLLFGGFNATFFTIGDEKFHTLSYDEAFLRKALAGAGFAIDDLEVLESKLRNESFYCEHICFIKASKIEEPDL